MQITLDCLVAEMFSKINLRFLNNMPQYILNRVFSIFTMDAIQHQTLTL